MRPIRLKLEGFTSFPKPVDIPFEGMDLFAITGPTGAGKTSILDAILYALYGRTPRIGEKEIQRLISMGSTTAKVSLEFLSGGKRHRITRSFKTTTTILLEEHTEGEWRQVSGKVREVNEKLPVILGLDFTGFTRSVMLPQGEFDEFLRGDPVKRNQILMDLLNLHGYERMKQAANSKAKELATQRDFLEKQLISFAHATGDALLQAENKLAQLREQLAGHEREEQRLAALLPLAADLERLRKEAADLERELKSQTISVPECDLRIRELEDQIAALGYDETVYLEFAKAVNPARRKAEAEKNLKAKAGVLSSWTQAKSSLQTAQEALSKFRETHGSTDLIRSRQRDLREAEAAMLAFADGEAALAARDAARDAYERLRTEYAAFELRRHLHTGDTCPVCEQVIGKLPATEPNAALEHAKAVAEQAERRAREYQRAADTLAGARLRTGEPGDLDERIRQSQALETEARRWTEIEALAAKVEEARLALEAFPGCSRLPVAAIDATLQQQEQARRDKSEFEAELARVHAVKDQAAVLAGKALLLESHRGRIATLEQQLRETPNAPLLHSQVKLLLQSLQSSIIKAEVAIETIRRDMAQAAELRTQIAGNQSAEATYKTLGQLLKSDEFIAYVQREALTHLAAAASEQLHGLSEGRYTLALGNDNDFTVIDNWNAGEPRSVKTLSGGESFLASLALALALSQGLADFATESARSRLDSLFIDEGISSLDPDSLETAISALTALSANGDRMVGVISHLAELAERLPGAIRIEKSPGGSRVMIQSRKISAANG